MGPRRLLRITAENVPIASSTRVTGAGRSVVVFATAVPAIGLTVTSTYVGAAGVESAVLELVESAAGAQLRERTVRRALLPITSARPGCLLDHASCVERAASELHAGVRVDTASGVLGADGIYV